MRLRATWLLLALLAAPLRAEEAAQAAPGAPAAAAPFLWEVQGPKARHYLLGSVHLLPPSSRPLPAALDAAYDATQALVVETDLEALAAPQAQAGMVGAAREDRKGGLQARIGKGLYAKLQKRAAALGMPTPVCAELRAWFCALAMELFPLQQAQFSVEFGIDREYYDRAREDDRPVIPLETPEFQVALFAQMPEPMQKDMLAATLDEATTESQAPDELYRMWRSGDLAALDEVVKDLRRRYPKLYARILADRNRAWAGPLAERLKQDVPLLVVVGAAHLPGADGLLALLKARGLDAQPVTAVMEAAPPVSPE
ncbi:MAG: TraB/GumN family protein [Gammaproteobacteria bacterium]